MTESAISGGYAAVESLLSRYFDGLYASDAAALSEIFHPQAHYVCAVEGEFIHRTMNEYLPVVAARESPESRGEARRDRIVSIEFAGPAAAVARVNCAIGERFFTDILTLVREGGEWRIVSKVFHYDKIA